MPHRHGSSSADVPDKPRRPLLLASVETENTFDEIPVMWVVYTHVDVLLFKSIVRQSDLKGASATDPTVKRGIADQIRDASINVGFFYSACAGCLLF